MAANDDLPESAWYDPVTQRINADTGEEIPPEGWKRWEWYDVTTYAGYKPGVHLYVKVRAIND